MSLQNKLQIVDYFGPRVARVKLDQVTVTELQAMCNSAEELMTEKLVGFIREEINLIEQMCANRSVHNQLLEHINNYLYDIDTGIWNEAIHAGSLPGAAELTEAWYNKQVAGEHNPPHHHNYSADIVCVIFTHVELDNDESKYYTVAGGEKQRGQLNLVYGDPNEKNGFGKTKITIEPKVGDMYIFPAGLTHYTTPVVGNSVRYSVACNFNITSLVKRLQKKLIKGKHGF